MYLFIVNKICLIKFKTLTCVILKATNDMERSIPRMLCKNRNGSSVKKT